MLSDPIRAANNSQMLPGGAGISRSLREKIECSFLSLQSCSQRGMVFILFIVGDVSGGSAQYIQCPQRPRRKGERGDLQVCLLLALKTTILSDPLINCLPAMTTANIQPSTLSLSLCRAPTKCLSSSCNHSYQTWITMQQCCASATS